MITTEHRYIKDFKFDVKSYREFKHKYEPSNICEMPIKWKEAKKDKSDALMRSFDTTIESKSYIQGFVDAIVSFTKDADEDKLLKEFKVEEMK